MPRLPYSLIARACSVNPLLPSLLPQCRNLQSAISELRWMQQCVNQRLQANHVLSVHGSSGAPSSSKQMLHTMVRQRARGWPLQYVIGDQPFGNLEILCRRGVLIPRPETEAYTETTARVVRSTFSKDCKLRIVDLCSGTGCISLLMHSLLAEAFEHLSINGVEISPKALRLARENLAHNADSGYLRERARKDVRFSRGNVLLPWNIANPPHPGETVVVLANPPYVSPRSYIDGTTARGVRLSEPKLALVPKDSKAPRHNFRSDGILQQDIFYPAILAFAAMHRARLAVMECGDPLQAQRVVRLSRRIIGNDTTQASVEIWRCDGGFPDSCSVVDDEEKDCMGSQGARAVVIRVPDGSWRNAIGEPDTTELL